MSYDFFLILFSYICGSIPFGLLISYVFKTNDPRNIGSKNIGATNVLRTGGLKLGLMTLILDILKGFIAIKITLILNPNLVGLSIIFVVIGHIFPIWLKFQGRWVWCFFCLNKHGLLCIISVNGTLLIP